MLLIQDWENYELTPKEIKELLSKYQKGDLSAKDTISLSCMGFVYKLATKYSGFGEIEDYCMIGVIGLLKGIDTCDLQKCPNPKTYFYRCIENEILMYLRKRKTVTEKTDSLQDEIGIRRHTNSEGDTVTREDYIPDETASVEQDIEDKILYNDIRKSIDKLKNPLHRQVMYMRFGLNGQEQLTQRQVAKELNITQSYVGIIVSKVISSLREKFAA